MRTKSLNGKRKYSNNHLSAMKKVLLILTTVCFSTMLLAQTEGQTIKGVHPYKLKENKVVAKAYSNWSIIPYVGFNGFDGDFGQELKHPISIPTAGLGLEYSFNPVWGVGLEYMFDIYNVTGDPNSGHTADTLLHGMMHRVAGYVSMDLMNLFYPHARKKILSLNATVGGGYGWWMSTLYYKDDDDHPKGQTLNYVNDKGEIGPDAADTYDSSPFVQFGLNVEFNLNRTLALGVRASYDYFMVDRLDHRGIYGRNAAASKNNDGLFDIALNMRFKLQAVSKSHMRNMSGYHMMDLAEQEKQKNGNGKGSGRDTVIIRHDSIIVREVYDPSSSTYASSSNSSSSSSSSHTERIHDAGLYYYVYFDNGRSNLREDGLMTIQQVADRMAEDPSLYAIVVGYCDNTGSNDMNYALGDRRAANVIDELREEHGISDSHVFSGGLGKLVGKRSTSSYGPNRRAVIRLVDKATFDRMSSELREKMSQRHIDSNEDYKNFYINTSSGEDSGTDYTATNYGDVIVYETEAQPVDRTPVFENARREKENPYANRPSVKTGVGQSTTLSKLARQYYNNTYCWVYIYIANREMLANPNDLEPGMSLVIPELTKEEMRITKDQCLRMYSQAKKK